MTDIKKTPVGIAGVGYAVPERILTNHDLEQMVETSDEWIVTRTGIRERRLCGPEEFTSDIATLASRRALQNAGIKADQLDMIICCTITPDYTCPSVACMIQSRLGIERPIAAFDLAAACSGFIYGCSVGAAMIQNGTARRVLVVAAESMTKVVDFSDRNTCVLFGDGAGAAVLAPTESGRGLLGQCLGAGGGGWELITVPGGVTDRPKNGEKTVTPQYLQMNGNEVYKFATRICGSAILEALASAGGGLVPEDLDLIIPHQANIRIIETAARKLNLPMDRFVVNIERYGNTSAATVPLALAEAVDGGKIKAGSLVGLVAFGGGLTYAASIWRW